MADELVHSGPGGASPRRGWSRHARGLLALGLTGLVQVALVVGAVPGGYLVSPVAAAGPVSLTQTADTSPVNAADPIGYTITLTNAGPLVATGVTLTDPLPGGSGSGVTWVKDLGTGNPAAFSLAGAQGSQSLTLAGQPVSLAAGASLSVHVTASTSRTECGTYDNTATLASDVGGNASSASIVCNPASVSLTKVADASSVSAGDQIGYTITVANTGPGVADAVTFKTPCPPTPA